MLIQFPSNIRTATDAGHLAKIGWQSPEKLGARYVDWDIVF